MEREELKNDMNHILLKNDDLLNQLKQSNNR